MLKIKVPATTANLCVGFDSLGMALSLYNVFSFEKAKEDSLKGFKEKYLNDNLVLDVYKNYFKKFEIEYIPVSIELVEENVFESRGLGSSATCIVAGALGAYYLSGKTISKDKLESFIIECEGHPDNVMPALIGGFVSSFKTDNKYDYVKYDVSKLLNIYALVPNFELKTAESRKVLPKKLTIEECVNNISRVSNLPYALKNGDINLLKELFHDKIHEPYRLKLIKNAEIVYAYFENKNAAICISGAGPTLLVISKDEYNFDELVGFKLVKLKVNNEGAEVYEV